MGRIMDAAYSSANARFTASLDQRFPWAGMAAHKAQRRDAGGLA
jgi:hypothetical protein